ncbi:MAG TPA: GtrA family protein [Solirubrobacteraceae bacterium]|jgi:putative flippase GtrA|nr:GtrA family protein [Solirubrobacteraceae bacterium]
MREEASSTLEFAAVAPELPAPVKEHHAHTIKLPFHIRVRAGVRKPHNWLQFVRFGAVGATGYVVNLAVFAFCVHVLQIDYRVSAVIAWVVSVLNNFWFNRHWTFRAKQAHPMGQGIRFFAVSLVTFGFSYLVLIGLVEGAGMTKVLAQAIAVAAGTPLNFVGQKLWSFKV